MNLQNGYKVIYEKIADGTRIFYASKSNAYPAADDKKLVEAKIGEYKLIYEKGGRFYGSKSGIPAEGDYCFEGFEEVFVEATEEETKAPVDNEEPDLENSVIETPEEVEGGEF